MLTVGEKIKQIRKAKGYSQENLAHDINVSTSTICRIEQGMAVVNGDILKTIKKALGVESAPLLPGEGEGFKERLYIWHKLILDGHLVEARTLQKGLSDITALPFESDLATLYQLFDISLLLAEQNYAEAEILLCNLNTNEMNQENQYHFYYNMGWVYMCIGEDRAKEPLDFLLKAYEIQEKPDGSLCYRIARCLTRLGQPFSSMAMLDNAYKAYNDNKTTTTSLDLDNKMALNCIDIGDTVRAKEILEKCLANARKISHERYIAVILHNIGSAYAKEKNWETAYDYFLEADEYFNKTQSDFVNIYYKARCLVALRRFAQCKELLSQGLESANEYYNVMFNSINHLITIREYASHEYLETVTIPYLVNRYNITDALDYCEILEEFHENRGSTKKALELAKIQRDIYKRMIHSSFF